MIFLWETIPPVKNILVKYEEFRDTTSYLSRKKNIAQFRLCGKGDLFYLTSISVSKISFKK